jgi:hypothetical protein
VNERWVVIGRHITTYVHTCCFAPGEQASGMITNAACKVTIPYCSVWSTDGFLTQAQVTPVWGIESTEYGHLILRIAYEK